MIEAVSLRKTFGAEVALDGVDFTAPDGRITGLIGPNGAGKTTALRILYTVLRPDSGTAAVDGHDVVRDRLAVQHSIGVVPDTRGLYPRLTAREHIRYYGRLHGMADGVLNERIGELSRRLGMADFIDRRARGFSKGQTHKVALARALVHRPQNFLLDEPTNGLDVPSARAVHDLIREMRDEGRCILFCSHIMTEVAAVSDRIIVLAHGRVAAEGALAELQESAGTTDMETMFLTFTGEGRGVN